MHKDLSDVTRAEIDAFIPVLVRAMHEDNESLGLAREAIINAFDKAAEGLDAG